MELGSYFVKYENFFVLTINIRRYFNYVKRKVLYFNYLIRVIINLYMYFYGK